MALAGVQGDVGEMEKWVTMLKMRGDLPVSLAKDFSRGFSALLTYYEGMLMIRFVPLRSGKRGLMVVILRFRCVIVFIREDNVRGGVLIVRRQVMIMYCSSLPFSLV
jgi:hypothetical protein